MFRAVLYFSAQHDELSLPLPSNAAEIRALLLDIEGTTTPVDFVYKTLFPFAGAHVEDFLRRHFHEKEIAKVLEELRQACSADLTFGAPRWEENTDDGKLQAAVSYVRWLIARDSKITPLKTLQGKIWEEGFLRSGLKGEVYSDVAEAFARWKAQGRRIAIFSSGSVLAQKLLFANSTAGDLAHFLEAYFDTTTGPKREAASYRIIARSLELEPEQILFVSDVGEELDAARAAGMSVALSLRPGISCPARQNCATVHSFAEIFP